MAITPTIEWAPGADLAANPATWTWTDITTHVRGDVTITRGRVDEAGQTQPTKVTFALRNPDGRWTPYHPASSGYPYVQQGTPFRVRVDIGSGPVTRATVFADSFEVNWDGSLDMAIVDFTGSGLLQRLTKGKTPARSLLTTWNLTDPPPVVYWPGEDTSGSTSLAEATGSGRPMTWLGMTPALASAGPAGSAPLPKMVAASGGVPGTGLAGPVPTYASSTAWTVAFVVNRNAAPSPLQIPLVKWVTYGSVVDWRFTLYPGSPDQMALEGFTGSGSTAVLSQVAFTAGAVSLPYQRNLLVWATAIQSGGNINWSVTVLDELTAGSTTWTGSVAGTLGNIVKIEVPPGWNHDNDIYGHFAIYDVALTYPADLLGGRIGETAYDRISEAAGYAGVPVVFVGSAADTQPMGAWPIGAFPDVARECEAADGGILFEGFDPQLVYRTRTSRYNQTAKVTGNAKTNVGFPFRPVEDDTRRRNDWTIKRKGGSEGRDVDQADIDARGRYDDSATINADEDTLLASHAGWRVNLGTVNALRYKTQTLNLTGQPALQAAWLTADIGDRITVTNLPAQHPPGDLDVVLEGYTEVLSKVQWAVTANCSPYLPWEVYQVADSTRGRVDTAGSQLAAGVSATATSLSVATTTGPLWTTTALYPADFPFYIAIDGEQIRVTAISGTSSPQTFTVIRSINGISKTHSSGAAVQLWRPAVRAL